MIPLPKRNGKKIEGEFYPLQKAELIALRHGKIINNAAFVHFALRYENPFCDRPIEILPKEFALRWGMPESSVYEAIAKLKDKGIFKTRLGKVTIQWVIHSQQETHSDNPEFLRDPRIHSEIPENIPESQNELRDPRIDSEVPENRPPKPSSNKDFNLSQTLQTNQTSQTIQTGVEGVENSFQDPDLDLVNKENCLNEQNYSQQEEVKQEKKVNFKDPGKVEIFRDAVQCNTENTEVVQSSTPIGTKELSQEQSFEIGVERPLTSTQDRLGTQEIAECTKSEKIGTQAYVEVSRNGNAADVCKIPQNLLNKLEDLGISIDEQVRRAIADHDISQAYGAVKHVENTWESINNPRSVFLHQIPKQRVQKGPKPISEEFLEWYQWAIAEGLVVDRPPEHLPKNFRGEPRVTLMIDHYWLEDWEKVRDNPDDYREKIDPKQAKQLWAKAKSVLKAMPDPSPEVTLNEQLNDPILGAELYPKIKHTHHVEFTEVGRPYAATEIIDFEYDTEGIPVGEVKQ
jgi:hypothetical protein